MARKDDVAPELTQAATALEEELRRFEAHAHSAAHAPLRSRQHLERAAKELEALADSNERLTAGVQALLNAIQRAKRRKDAQVVEVSAAAIRLQGRTARYQHLMEQYSELGRAATRLAPNGTALGEAVPTADALFDGLGELAARAQSLADAARADEFDDVAQSADGLREQLLSLRNQLELASGREDLPV